VSTTTRSDAQGDLVIVTLKSTENHQFKQLIPPLLHENTAILTLQNGLGNEDDLASLFGRERVLGGIAFVCINRVAPGELQHTEAGYIRIGEYAGETGRSARAEGSLKCSTPARSKRT
jgi:2-dehydropantoate 2-reductase